MLKSMVCPGIVRAFFAWFEIKPFGVHSPQYAFCAYLRFRRHIDIINPT